ncbi:MAG: CHAT domain-containing protein [Phormidesmis sp.]
MNWLWDFFHPHAHPRAYGPAHGLFGARCLKRWRLRLLCGLTCLWVMAGHWNVAVIASSAPDQLPVAEPSLHQAQLLNAQGQQAIANSQPEVALEYWQQAEAAYRSAGDQRGIWGSQINQAKALQTLGFYRRAQGQLAKTTAGLSRQPSSLLKINAWLTYGRGFRLLGEFDSAQLYLEEGLKLAQELSNQPYQQTAHLYLGNALAAKQQWKQAKAQYDQATALTGPLQLTARLRQLQTLIHLNQDADIRPQAQLLMQRFMAEEASPTRVHLILDLVQWLLQYAPDTLSAIATDTLFKTTILQANALGDTRAESYGWGYLGRWHEQQHQWTAAIQETQTALSLAQNINADELRYQWEWQQGRIARSQGKRQEAIAHYSNAINSLHNLRQDIVAITRDVQFSFRDQIEPIYRDLVELMLPPVTAKDVLGQTIDKRSSREKENLQNSLEQARHTLEDLQLAELNNFFREPCLESVPQAIETLDPTAAVLYPIILPDRFSVILSIPNRPLRYYSQAISQASAEADIQAMLNSARVTSFTQERLNAAQQMYQWLIEPAEATLQANGIQTLAFVLDDSLRNLPIAALHNGEHYLIEDYQLAISPGLQLLKVNKVKQPTAKNSVLIGGLSDSKDGRPPLIGVEQEVAHVKQLLDSRVLLNQTFTNTAIISQTQKQSFDIVHLATHAQFGETEAETFIETWDDILRISQLRQLLTQQKVRGRLPALLVLSACDTAQGNNQTALGMAGLAVRAGAQSTLATLWSVNDQATATFIQQFYDGLINRNLTKAGAVRYAQQQLIRSPEFNHPFYWAPFVLVGDWL